MAKLKNKSISIIMPALNEEDAIAETIQAIPIRELNKMGYNVEILVIDGGSKDKTVQISKKYGAKVILSEKGYGKQYKNGFNACKSDIIATLDSDNTYPVHLVPKFVSILETQDVEFISMNRFGHLNKGSMRPVNFIGNIILTTVTNLLFNANMKDSQSGMWIFKRNILKRFNLTSDGMPFSQELKIEALKKSKFKEVDGSYDKRLGESKLSRFKDGFGNIWELIKKRYEI